MAQIPIYSPFKDEKSIFRFGHEKTSKFVEKCLLMFASAITETSDTGYKDALMNLQHSFMQWAIKIMGADDNGDLSEEGEKIFDENLAKPDADPNFLREMLKANPTVGNKILGEKPTTKDFGKIDSKSSSGKEDLEACLGPKSTLGTLLFERIPMFCKIIRNHYAEFSGDFKESFVPSYSPEYLQSKAKDALQRIDPPNYPSPRPAK
ncbi:uncharacterized protein CCOS01_01300 [Colletotrichum costaricense]|uniref:Uncharacterized protein n=1 Tax=Colletotrichum costaricense TaxID=1209916 RepID=A0AAJ0E7X7_9PEZI|nr:uncharacterized protein CCOS01_01300 [Colletotrichum costaricense]KAK1539986.1 hypothetical protein CCOS01_01300 [Colletotrichum costaricense]